MTSGLESCQNKSFHHVFFPPSPISIVVRSRLSLLIARIIIKKLSNIFNTSPVIFFSMEGGFDVYNIETAMPKIDLDAIESHLRAAREEERRVSEYSIYIYI